MDKTGIIKTSEDDTWRFTKPWEDSDICFLVEDKRVYAIKVILKSWSPVFKAMFSSEFAEKDSKEISLPGKKFSDVVTLMKVLHPPTEDIHDKNVTILLPLVEEYQILTLKERCEKYLLTQPKSIQNCLIASQYCLSTLLKYNKEYLIKHTAMNELETSKQFRFLPNEIIIDIVFGKHKLAIKEARKEIEHFCLRCPHGEGVWKPPGRKLSCNCTICGRGAKTCQDHFERVINIVERSIVQ